MSETIRIAATGIAEFIGSTPAQRLRILRPYKKRKSGEAKGRGHYYRAALNAIRQYFREGKDSDIILDAIQTLELEKKGPLKRGGLAQINHNIRVLKAFSKHHAGRDLVLVDGRRMQCNIGKVEVTCTPDLWAEDNGKLVLIKFYFSAKKPKTLQIPVLLHLLREGAHNIGLKPSVICLDMDGVEHLCHPDRQKMRAIVAQVEMELQSTWQSL